MGMDQSVRFPAGSAPAWPAVRGLLAGHGFPVKLMMTDGELSFPDEEPPESWRELRLGTPQGMVTVRRAGGVVTCVTWGNADAALRQAWNAVAWAFAAAGGGTVGTAEGPADAAGFRRQAEMPAVIKA